MRLRILMVVEWPLVTTHGLAHVVVTSNLPKAYVFNPVLMGGDPGVDPWVVGSAQPVPVLTMPTSCRRPAIVETSGPPESPWHASTPAGRGPAQISWSTRKSEPYARHNSFRMGR